MKKVLVTGGNGDIAQAIIKKLLSTRQYEVNAPGKEKLDVTNIESVNDFLDGYTPDVLVNNAGIVCPQSIKKCDLLQIKKSLEINLFGTFNCSATVLKRNPEALIINIGSSAATKEHDVWSSYCAAKAGVVMATKCWAADGVNAVCVSPGRTATKMRSELFPDEDKKTLLKAEDFATIVCFAIEGRYTSGSHINVSLQNVEEMLNA